MTERTIALDLEEWQRVLQILAGAPWSAANPLIMKIGEQLRLQEKSDPNARRPDGAGDRPPQAN